MYYLVLLINLSRSILLVIFSKNIFHVFFYGQFWHLPWWNYLNKALLLIHLFRINIGLFCFWQFYWVLFQILDHIFLFFTLYWNGQIEFTALLVSSIVQDGHGSCSLGELKARFSRVKFINTVIALLVIIVLTNFKSVV